MKVTGQILRETRERKGIPITDVSSATKISSKILIAMEEGDLESLPTKTFLRGFVRSYALYLGMNVEQTLNTFTAEMGTTNPAPLLHPTYSSANSSTHHSHSASRQNTSQNKSQPSNYSTNRAADSTSNTPSSSQTLRINERENPIRNMAVVGGIVALVVLIVLIRNKIESYQDEAHPPATLEPLAPIASPEPRADSTGSVENAAALKTTEGTSEANSPNANAPESHPQADRPADKLTDKPADKPADKVVEKTPKPEETVKPTETTSAPGALTGAATGAVAAADSATATAAAVAQEKPQDVLIEALNNVTVDVILDGEAKKITLRPEEIHNFKAKGKISLRFSDGGAVNLTVNGNDRGVPGDLGKPAKVEYP